MRITGEVGGGVGGVARSIVSVVDGIVDAVAGGLVGMGVLFFLDFVVAFVVEGWEKVEQGGGLGRAGLGSGFHGLGDSSSGVVRSNVRRRHGRGGEFLLLRGSEMRVDGNSICERWMKRQLTVAKKG